MTIPVTAVLGDKHLDPAVAEQFRIAFGLNETPTTLEEWVELASELLKVGFRNSSKEQPAMNSPRHDVHVGNDSYHTTGLFEALVIPFLQTKEKKFLLHSRSPLSGSSVVVRANSDHVSVDPENAVMSFGVAEDIIAPDYFDVPADIAYHRFNQYTNAFPDEAAYEDWTTHAIDIDTMTLSIADALVLARSVTNKWDELNGFLASDGG